MDPKLKQFRDGAIKAMEQAIAKVREEHRKSGKPMIIWDDKNKKVIEKFIK